MTLYKDGGRVLSKDYVLKVQMAPKLGSIASSTAGKFKTAAKAYLDLATVCGGDAESGEHALDLRLV